MPTEKKLDAEELPYFTLLRKIPIKWVEWATKEVPVSYVIANCSNNESSYNKDLVLLQKRDFYKALDETLKPEQDVQLSYSEAKADAISPNLESTKTVKLEFQGRDILSRGGLYQTVLKADPQFQYLHILKNFLEVFKLFVSRNSTEVQKVLLQKQYSCPWEVFQDLMKNKVLKHAFFSEVEAKLGAEMKGLLLEKWEAQHG